MPEACLSGAWLRDPTGACQAAPPFPPGASDAECGLAAYGREVPEIRGSLRAELTCACTSSLESGCSRQYRTVICRQTQHPQPAVSLVEATGWHGCSRASISAQYKQQHHPRSSTYTLMELPRCI